jgi:nucleoid-associated protein YgaU
LFVSGSAAPGATLRLYLNDTFIAPGGTGPDGHVSFSIERGIRPGDYRVRLDDVDPVTGEVRSRAEVPFNVPAVVATTAPASPAESRPTPPEAGIPPPLASAASDPSVRSLSPAARRDQEPDASPNREIAANRSIRRPSSSVRSQRAGTRAAARETCRGVIVVPEVNTAIVSRGDNLWRISKRNYGSGLRYTVIYGANLPQIRDPGLIFPGQVFVIPSAPGQARR